MGMSVTDPISLAINRAKLITFQPFDLGKWFTLGFAAFLSTLGEGGMNFRIPSGGSRPMPAPAPIPRPGGGPVFTPSPPPDPFSDTWNWITANLPIAIGIALVAAALILAIWLTLLWINSRGKFIFLEGIACNTCFIQAPWKRYRELGNSLFKFRATLGLIGFGSAALVAAIGLAIAWSDIQAQTFGSGATLAVLLALAVMLPVGIALSITGWVTTTFVATIMYATNQPVLPAWREFREDVANGNIGSIILFMLMQIVLAIAVGIAGLILGCVTCCIGFFPYLSSVVTLPLAIFLRAYSVYFLQQFSPRYVIIREEPPTPRTYGFAVITPDNPPPPPLAT